MPRLILSTLALLLFCLQVWGTEGRPAAPSQSSATLVVFKAVAAITPLLDVQADYTGSRPIPTCPVPGPRRSRGCRCWWV